MCFFFLRAEDVLLANGFLVQAVPIRSPGEFPQKFSVKVAWIFGKPNPKTVAKI